MGRVARPTAAAAGTARWAGRRVDRTAGTHLGRLHPPQGRLRRGDHRPCGSSSVSRGSPTSRSSRRARETHDHPAIPTGRRQPATSRSHRQVESLVMSTCEHVQFAISLSRTNDSRWHQDNYSVLGIILPYRCTTTAINLQIAPTRKQQTITHPHCGTTHSPLPRAVAELPPGI